MILHHFEASPFSEKIRSILGFKGLAWRSVLVPRILPKPDLMPLTGGYRRTPVLQIGRDIYADTRLIARVIEARYPEPRLIPAACGASVVAFEQLADQQLFLAAIPVMLSSAGRRAMVDALGEGGMAAFRKDRAALFASGNLGAPDAASLAGIWQPSVEALNRQLEDKPYLLGCEPTLADFAVHHPIWYVRSNPGVAHRLDDFPAVLAWADRIAAIGHGRPAPLSAAEALEIARETRDFEPCKRAVDAAIELVAGDDVTVAAVDYGSDPVRGTLVRVDHERITIERNAPDIGMLRNHFPRRGFRVTACGEEALTATNSAYTEGEL